MLATRNFGVSQAVLEGVVVIEGRWLWSAPHSENSTRALEKLALAVESVCTGRNHSRDGVVTMNLLLDFWWHGALGKRGIDRLLNMARGGWIEGDWTRRRESPIT